VAIGSDKPTKPANPAGGQDLQAKLQLKPTDFPPNNATTTGMSISRSNYLNLPANPGAQNLPQQQPTWKVLSEQAKEDPSSNFYA
jgi:hypothetical protein